MGKIKQIIAQYGDTLENTYPVTLAEAVMYYKDGKLSSLKEYLDELKVEATGDYLPLPESTLDTPDYLVGVNTDSPKTYKVSQIPAKFLPSYVDDVIEGTLDTFPKKGETGKIYVDTNTNLSYRWTGSTYVEIGKSTVLNDAGSLSKPVYISGGNAIPCDIQIGGRNYILNSISSVTYNADSTGSWVFGISEEFANIASGTDMCLSFDCVNTITSGRLRLRCRIAGRGSGIDTNLGDFTVSSVSSKYTYTVKCKGVYTGQVFYVENSDAVGSLTISNVKLELGNQPTDWTPAPEDVEADIDTAKTEVINGNVASATKLQTSRKLWGNDFNGTADINGTIKFVKSDDDRKTYLNSFGQLVVGVNNTSANQFIGNRVKRNNDTGSNICCWGALMAGQTLDYWSVGKEENNTWLRVYPTGNVTIGQTTDSGYKLDVNGSFRCTDIRCTDVKNASFLGTDANGKLIESISTATTGTAGLMSSADKTKLNGIATGAEVNQNAFSNITIGSTTIAADAKTDTLTLVAGSNVTLTPDATSDKITIAATNTTYSAASQSAAGLMSAADKKKLDGIATGANAYSHPTGSGNNHIPSGGSSGQILRWSANGTATWGNDNNTTYGVVSTTANGLCPKLSNSTVQFLRGDGAWATPPNTDTKVTQSSSSSGSSYPILASASTAPAGAATTAIYNANIKMNPSAGSITATAFYQTSDINKKDIHGDINLSIEDILSIPTIEFNYKEDDKTHIGTIAQEVEKVCPEIVQTDNEGFKSVDYAKLSVLAIKALKDTHKELSSLKEEVEQIKALLHGKI